MRAVRAFRFPPGRRFALTGATVALTLAGAVSTASAAVPGTLDPSFGTAGSSGLPANTRLFADAVQSNGDLVAVGESGSASNTTPRLLLVRFTPTGALDTSFGSGGLVSGPIVSGTAGSIGRAVAIQADGKVVVVGKATDSSGTARDGLLVERFDANGAPDTSFGTGGVVNLLNGDFGDGYAVAVQPNGEILAGGDEAPSGTPFVAVARLSTGGTLDSSFGSGGIDELDLGAYSIAQALALQPNGDIVLAGSQSPQLQAVNSLIARLTPAGKLDPTFAGTGAVANNYAPPGGAYSSLNGVAVEANGDIVAAGNAAGASGTADTVVVRFTAAGAPDSSFGTGGVALTPSATDWQEQGSLVPGADAVAIAGNGDIIAAGQFDDSVLAYGTLWAFNSSGHLDTSFGSNGAAVFKGKLDENSEWAGVAVSPITGYLDVVGDAFSPGGQGYSGLAASYIGYGPPKSTIPPLKLTLSAIRANDKAGTLAFSATCNEACSLKATLSASAGAARKLKIATTVKKCTKKRGKTTCKKVKEYKAVTIATGKGTLGAAGTKRFTLHLSKADRNALHKLKSVSLSLSVTATSTATKKTAKASKTVRFTK